MAGAGYSLESTRVFAKLYALRHSNNYDAQDQLGWIAFPSNIVLKWILTPASAAAARPDRALSIGVPGSFWTVTRQRVS
jgi:hypothetical protein